MPNTRNDEIRDRLRVMREESPHRSAADMARELCVTRSYVSRLLDELGLPTVVRYEPPKKRGKRG